MESETLWLYQKKNKSYLLILHPVIHKHILLQTQNAAILVDTARFR